MLTTQISTSTRHIPPPPQPDFGFPALNSDGVHSEHAIELNYLDQEILELTGDLPGLPLFLSPETRDRFKASPTLVHTLETSASDPYRPVPKQGSRGQDLGSIGDEKRLDYTYRGYLLRPRVDQYRRARELYALVDGSPGGKNSSRLQDCRSQAWFVRHKETQEVRVSSSRCKLRWCPICRDVSRLIVTRAVEEWLKEEKFPKMLTFTLEHNDDPLQIQIKKLYHSFRKIRGRKFFKDAVTGGVWFFQLKYNHQSCQWHPHIHCLIGGGWLSHGEIKKHWHQITGDSFIVDIRPIKDVESAATEVARYATSPADLSKLPLELAADVYYATKSQRICGTWGNAKGMVLKPTSEGDHDDWERLSDFYSVNVTKKTDPDARALWHCYKSGEPYTGEPLQEDKILNKDIYDDLYFRLPPQDPGGGGTLSFVRTDPSVWLNFYDEIDLPQGATRCATPKESA